MPILFYVFILSSSSHKLVQKRCLISGEDAQRVRFILRLAQTDRRLWLLAAVGRGCRLSQNLPQTPGRFPQNPTAAET